LLTVELPLALAALFQGVYARSRFDLLNGYSTGHPICRVSPQDLTPGPFRTRLLVVLLPPLKASELSLIRSLRDQLKRAQQELKVVTAKIDVALSKASLASDVENFILGEIENLGKAIKCKFLSS
jgi:hypothetical protein